MATYTPQSTEERLARLKAMQENLAKVNTGFDSNVLTLENGLHIVRILPPVGNMDQNFYHQAVGYHMIGSNVVRCSDFTTSKEIGCPVCEVCEVLKRGSQRDKLLYNGFKTQNGIKLVKKYWMNVIVREANDMFNTYKGPFIYKAGFTVFDRTRSFVNDPSYGLIDDPVQGIDMSIQKSGQGIDTTYQVNPRRGDNQPLMGKLVKVDGRDRLEADWDAITEILSKAQDLAPVIMPDNPDEDEEALSTLDYDPAVKVYTYDRTVGQYGVSLDTIHELEDIIRANQGDSQGDDGDGRAAMPQRGSNNRQSGNRSGDTSSDAIKARIAGLRNK